MSKEEAIEVTATVLRNVRLREARAGVGETVTQGQVVALITAISAFGTLNALLLISGEMAVALSRGGGVRRRGAPWRHPNAARQTSRPPTPPAGRSSWH